MNFPRRPNRLLDKKDEAYHAQYAWWCISNYSIGNHYNIVNKYMVNSAFYKGDQWIHNEDLDAFLLDESGDVRNRIRFVNNIVKPYVEYLRGSVVRMDVNYSVENISRNAINRRDEALQRKLQALKVANMFTGTGVREIIIKREGLEQTEEDTIARFNNLYNDEYAMGIRNLTQYVSEIENDFEEIKNELAEYLAINGIGIVKEDDRNGRQKFDTVSPVNFIYDQSARKRDLSDAQYMGDFDMLTAVDIIESYPNLSYAKRNLIENARMSSKPAVHNVFDIWNTSYSDKIPVYSLYWEDLEIETHGAVLDEGGYPILVNLDRNDKYSEKDLIPESELEKYKYGNDWIDNALGGKNKKKVPVSYTRFCKFIPVEYCEGIGEDLVLDFGVRNYSMLYSLTSKKKEFPYLVHIYSYFDGEIISPIDALISPQRYINRILSVAESHINNSRGSGYIFDGDSIDNQEGELGIQRDMNQSKPIIVNAGRNLNNAVMSYDNTVRSGTLNMFGIADKIKTMSEGIIGGGDALKGAGGGYRVSVGALQQNLNQGTILQESYFYSLTKVLFKSYDAIGNRGKRIYASNGRILYIAVGESQAVQFAITKDYEMEDFKFKFERAASTFEEKQAANNTLMLLLDKGLIDQKIFAKYFNCSDMFTVAYAIREYSAIMEETQRMAAQESKVQKNAMLDAAAADEQINELGAMANMIEQSGNNAASNNAKIISEEVKNQRR